MSDVVQFLKELQSVPKVLISQENLIFPLFYSLRSSVFLSNDRQILQCLMDIKKCIEQSLKMSNWSKIYKFELFRVFTKSLIFQSLRSE
jgi:hypothetical protein